MRGDIMARFTEVLLSKFSFVEQMFKESLPEQIQHTEAKVPDRERKD